MTQWSKVHFCGVKRIGRGGVKTGVEIDAPGLIFLKQLCEDLR